MQAHVTDKPMDIAHLNRGGERGERSGGLAAAGPVGLGAQAVERLQRDRAHHARPQRRAQDLHAAPQRQERLRHVRARLACRRCSTFTVYRLMAACEDRCGDGKKASMQPVR